MHKRSQPSPHSLILRLKRFSDPFTQSSLHTITFAGGLETRHISTTPSPTLDIFQTTRHRLVCTHAVMWCAMLRAVLLCCAASIECCAHAVGCMSLLCTPCSACAAAVLRPSVRPCCIHSVMCPLCAHATLCHAKMRLSHAVPCCEVVTSWLAATCSSWTGGISPISTGLITTYLVGLLMHDW